MSSKGVIVFAKNNGNVDYVKQAAYLAKRVKLYWELLSFTVRFFKYCGVFYQTLFNVEYYKKEKFCCISKLFWLAAADFWISP